MKWNSQANFDRTVKIIVAKVGDRRVEGLLGSDFLRWHRNWGAPASEGDGLVHGVPSTAWTPYEE